MARVKQVVYVLAMTVVMGAAAGCANSSGSLGKAKFSVLNVVSVEGEGITWDNRTPAAMEQLGR